MAVPAFYRARDIVELIPALRFNYWAPGSALIAGKFPTDSGGSEI